MPVSEKENNIKAGSRTTSARTRAATPSSSIPGVGFFLDAYDLFIINPVATMLQYRLYGGAAIPSGLQGFLKASANIGSVVGQFGFGYAADTFGRKAVYGKELIIIIFATIFSISDPTGDLSATGSILWLSIWRIILGIGIGGDYPMSASVATDRSNLRRRGTLLSYIFANQGWGSLVGSLMVIIVLACFHHIMEVKGETSKVDGVWRILVGLSLVPAFGTLYQRLTLPESRRFKASQKGVEAETESIDELKKKADADPGVQESVRPAPASSETPSPASLSPAPSANAAAAAAAAVHASPATKRDHWAEFFHYFSEWRHLRNVVLEEIGFDGKSGSAWTRLFKIGIGNLIVTALGFVPGYYVTILTIEWLGRKWIQIQGFLMAALFLGILAGKFYTLGTAAFIVNFAFLQFFFNFGANATTYCYPAEVFPTKFRASAHGMSAACGKAGAIISALVFNSLTDSIGTPNVLWIFFACCIAGAGFTLLLPEVKGRDPDLVYAEEVREEERMRRGM
ncbi:major facilitator superfamily domain-containing protein [Fomitopsis serialis]|uniref:major facilitator superfamily domain-containing protein n=1 Tax=Fomitopsis serialis TaxID=139415 RepID=UPI002007631C|nr:major facilitator superfamily domain-containing protein [Neoantrodia serialis]KAH9915086.1 major facilitator superfamily domain-containing protein [Neoantrodia serialis]